MQQQAGAAAAASTVLSLAGLEAHDPTSTERGQSGERRFLCPLPACAAKTACPSHRAVSVNTETGAWQCHRCGASGKLKEFWTEERTSSASASSHPSRYRRDAAKKKVLLLRRAFSLPPLPGAAAATQPPPSQQQSSAEKAERLHQFLRGARLRPLAEDTPGAVYLKGRGLLDLSACHEAGVRFSPNFHGRPAIVFPVRDGEGRLVAAQGRYIDGRDNPRMRTEGPRSQGVFATAPGALLDKNRLVLTEAPLDALSLAACGLPALALCGSRGVPEWLKERAAFGTVIAAFDADDAGDKAVVQLAADLALYGVMIRRLRPEGAKDWNALLMDPKRQGRMAIRCQCVDFVPLETGDLMDPFAENEGDSTEVG